MEPVDGSGYPVASGEEWRSVIIHAILFALSIFCVIALIVLSALLPPIRVSE